MAKYDWKDIIFNPEDERLEVGKKYFFNDYPQHLLRIANHRDQDYLENLIEVEADLNAPFVASTGRRYLCVIRAEGEDNVKYISYDFDYFATRKSLIGEFVKTNKAEVGEFQGVITGFQKSADEDFWCACISGLYMVTAEEFLENWTFEDDSPCGREI